ncbi:MAG: hypothetical protein HQK83_19310 [Fibrobacteria bacterium]|nr:hypothetical protein [Fibrobacteria bacterium]
MVKTQSLIILLVTILVGVALADRPQKGMVMADIFSLDLLTSKEASSDTRWTFEELIDAGISGVQLRAGTFGKLNYTQHEWVQEAHEYGLWVCGGVGVQNNAGVEQAGYMAAMGSDFIQIDEPFKGWGGNCAPQDGDFNENEYNQMKVVAKAQTKFATCPIIISDVDCNEQFENWPSIDGLFQELYADIHWTNYYPKAKTYKAANPSKFVGVWDWILVGDIVGTSDGNDFYNLYEALPDSKFELWFSDSWASLKNIILFIFWNKKSHGSLGSYGVNWSHRAAFMKKTTGMGGTLPEWRSFSQSGTSQSAPDCQVQVKQAFDGGIDPATVECYYTVDKEVNTSTRWIRHYDVSATGTKGTKEWITLTAKNIPFNKVGNTDNKVMFKITDVYPYLYFRGPRTFKRLYKVNVASLDWTGFNGIVKELPASLSVNIKHGTELNTGSASSEYSTDGGKTWKAHTAECSSGMNAKGQYIVTATDLPFEEIGAKLNKIRFSILSTGGDTLKSQPYPVTVQISPVVMAGASERKDANTLDFSVKFQDEKGLQTGTHETALKENTEVLLRFNGDMSNEVEQSNFTAVNSGATFVDETWSGNGTGGKALSFDGVDDYVDLGFSSTGPGGDFTVSAWIKATNAQPPISIGGNENHASLLIFPYADKVSITAWDQSRNIKKLATAAGTFSQNAWHHIAVSLQGGVASIYVDGNLGASANWTSFTIVQCNPLRLGKVVNRQWYFKGQLDEFQVVNRALTDAEIASDYNSGLYRYTGDGGISWSKWTRGDLTGVNGTTDEVTMSLTGMALSAKGDSLNRIQVVASDVAGNVGSREFILEEDDVVTVDAELQRLVAANFSPNHFRTKTKLSFELISAQTVMVNLYNVHGKLVCSIKPGLLRAGVHSLEWDGSDGNNQDLAAGQYFAKIEMGGNVMVKKVLMLK